jgi:hypothetical protein
MKKLSLLMMFAALGIFSLGCEPPKATAPVESENTSTDGGEEKPAAPAETKTDKPAEAKTEEKPAEEKSEPKSEEKPAETKPEEKPAEAPK